MDTISFSPRKKNKTLKKGTIFETRSLVTEGIFSKGLPFWGKQLFPNKKLLVSRRKRLSFLENIVCFLRFSQQAKKGRFYLKHLHAG